MYWSDGFHVYRRLPLARLHGVISSINVQLEQNLVALVGIKLVSRPALQRDYRDYSSSRIEFGIKCVFRGRACVLPTASLAMEGEVTAKTRVRLFSTKNYVCINNRPRE
jgi:hypothetical protein